MKLIHLVFAFLAITACAATPSAPLATKPAAAPAKPAPEAKNEKPKPAPIPIYAVQRSIANIDPDTLKVSFVKGASKEEVIDSVVNGWAQATSALNQCRAELGTAKEQLAKK